MEIPRDALVPFSSFSRTPISAGGVEISRTDKGNFTPRDLVRVRKAAQEFEAQLIASWWTSMRETFTSGTSGDEQELQTGQGITQDLAMQAMSMALASAGGFGFSNMALRHLRFHPESDAPIAPSDGASDTGPGSQNESRRSDPDELKQSPLSADQK